jgi:hypothetical protein
MRNQEFMAIRPDRDQFVSLVVITTTNYSACIVVCAQGAAFNPLPNCG